MCMREGVDDMVGGKGVKEGVSEFVEDVREGVVDVEDGVRKGYEECGGVCWRVRRLCGC